MHWYHASTWEHPTHNHAQKNLPIYPDDPTFLQQFAKDEAIPSTFTLTPELPHVNVIHKRAKAAKHFLEGEGDKSTFPYPSTKEFEPSPPEAPKCCIKQGPAKSSKKQEEITADEGKAKDGNE